MNSRIIAFVHCNRPALEDTAAELAVAAKKIDASSPLTVVVTGFGVELDRSCEKLRTIFQEVWKISDASLQHPTPELVREALAGVLPNASIVLLAHNDFGVDVAPGLSVKLNVAYVADVVGVEYMDGFLLRVICQEFGGQVNTHVSCNTSAGAVITLRPGAFRAEFPVPLSGVVLERSTTIRELRTRRYVTSVPVPSGDVDICKFDILVSVGRGIVKQENIALAQELADAIGAAVSCSRPVVDANWLDKSRQVGTSGKTVRPKVYLACGISGQFQHMAGLKGNPFIIAVNKNPKAPIFQVANVGVVADVLDFLPALTGKVREAHAVR